MTLPRIALTIGDPAGIGPEIVVRAAVDPEVLAVCRPLVVGNRASVLRALDVTGVHARVVSRDEGVGPGLISLVDVGVVTDGLDYGRVQPAGGELAWSAVQRATELALDDEVAAVVTAPLNKQALVAAGAPCVDHTSAFAGLTGSPHVLTMFTLDRLRIFFATRHSSLRDACDDVTQQRLLEVLSAADSWLRAHGLDAPRFGVAALNPHAGENGMFGREEIDVIAPAVHAACAAGIDAAGPVAADSVFHLCRQGRYDAVISMYHDQGHIAAKTLDFERTVAVTTGLPFVRTSVDHGTAFDIAGRGTASAVSMIEAVKVAARYLSGAHGA